MPRVGGAPHSYWDCRVPHGQSERACASSVYESALMQERGLAPTLLPSRQRPASPTHGSRRLPLLLGAVT